MQTLHGGSRLQEIARKWHDLAERRLDYFTDLYRSGRWRHYYTQENFAVRMLDVIKAARTWAEIAGQPSRERPPRRDDDMRSAA